MIRPEPVFRFGIIRPPEPPPINIAISLRSDLTSFATQLHNSVESQGNRESISRLVEAFLESSDFTNQPERLSLYDLLMRMAVELERSNNPLIDAVLCAVNNVFNTSAYALIQTQDYLQTRTQLIDALLALKIGHKPRKTPTDKLADLFRLMELIRVTAEDPCSINNVTFAGWMRAPIQLPEEIYPLPFRELEEEKRITSEDIQDLETVAQIQQNIVEIDKAIEDLLTIRVVQQITQSTNDDSQTLQAFTDRLVIPETEAEKLSPSTRNFLQSKEINPSTKPFFAILDQLEAEKNVSTIALHQIGDQPSRPRIRIGTTTLPAPIPIDIDDLALPEPSFSPVSPSGVMNLLVTRQQIKRYEAGEIAHIENIMQTESRNRETRRLRRTEETLIVEREETSVEERDLQTTERLELQREVESTLSEEQRFKLGFKLGVVLNSNGHERREAL